MNILVVLAGETLLDLKETINMYNIEYVVAVDGGYNHLRKFSLKPDIVIGDFDSIIKDNEIENLKVKQLNKEKDYTDFEYAINYINSKFSNNKIYVTGFVSFNRLEHFYANLKHLKANLVFIEKQTVIKMLLPGKYKIDFPGYISFFAFEEVENLNLSGFKYELKGYNLSINDTLCISNEIVSEIAEVEFSSGKLILFESEK